MGAARTPGSRRSRLAHRSIRYVFLTMVIVPVLCLVVFWGLAVALTPGGALVRQGLFSSGHHGLAEVAVQVGAGVIVVLAAAVLMGLFARRLTHEVSGLEVTARHVADAELPRILANLRGEEAPAGTDVSFTPPVAKITEIADAAAAITSLREAAVAAATDEAGLRRGIAQVFVSLARRNQSLLQRQLHLIDTLEQKATDPDDLAELFSLDHLTTRMRRHAENLIVLSGSSPGRSWSQPVPVIDVVRGAMAEVEDYQRVRVLSQSREAVIGSAAADLMHLLAELIENATLFSPSDTEVEVRAERVSSGFVIEVEDRGLGIQPALLSEINQKLLRPQDFSVAEPDRLGLFVVGRLAARHGTRVSLSESPHGGTTAVVLVPANVLVTPAATDRPAPSSSGEMPVIRTPRERTGRARRSRDAFSLMPRRIVPPGSPQPASPQPASSQPASSQPASFQPPRVSPPPPATSPASFQPSPVPLPRRADRPAPDGAPGPGTGGHHALPRRVRQASLSPHLKDRGPAGNHPPSPAAPATPAPATLGLTTPASNDAAPTAAERSPEAARDLVASFRAGWQREVPGEMPGPGPEVTVTPETALSSTGAKPALPQRRQGRPKSQPTAPPATAPPPTAAPQGEETQWRSGARQEPEQT